MNQRNYGHPRTRPLVDQGPYVEVVHDPSGPTVVISSRTRAGERVRVAPEQILPLMTELGRVRLWATCVRCGACHVQVRFHPAAGTPLCPGCATDRDGGAL